MRISTIILANNEPDLIEKVEQAGKQDQEWCEKKVKLSQRTSQGQEAPKNWQVKDRMLSFTNRLYISTNN